MIFGIENCFDHFYCFVSVESFTVLGVTLAAVRFLREGFYVKFGVGGFRKSSYLGQALFMSESLSSVMVARRCIILHSWRSPGLCFTNHSSLRAWRPL